MKRVIISEEDANRVALDRRGRVIAACPDCHKEHALPGKLFKNKLDHLTNVLTRMKANAEDTDPEALVGNANDLFIELARALAKGSKQAEIVDQIIAAYTGEEPVEVGSEDSEE